MAHRIYRTGGLLPYLKIQLFLLRVRQGRNSPRQNLVLNASIQHC